MGKRFVINPATGKLIPTEEATHLRQPGRQGPNIIGDMAETRSLLDGKVYSSICHYRDHVRAHDCRIAGNDFNNQPMTGPRADAPGLAQDIKRAIEES